MTEIQGFHATSKTIFEEVVRVMSEVTDTRNMFIALYDEDDTTIQFPLVYEQGQRIPDEEKIEGSKWGPRCFISASKSLTEWVIYHKTPLLIEKDINAWVKVQNIETFPRGLKCWLAAPILLRDKEVIGVVELQNFEREAVFDSNHRDLLVTVASTIGSQITIAIENARLLHLAVQTDRYRNLQQIAHEREKRLQLLQQISKRMTEASQNPGAVLELIARVVNDILGSDLTSLYLYDQITTIFTGGVSIGRDGRVEGVEAQTLPKLDDFANEIAKSQSSLFIEDTEKHSEISSFARQHQIRAFATLPLTIADAQGIPVTVGVLFVNFKSPHSFPEDEQELLGHLANQASVAIALTNAQTAALAQVQLAALGTAAGTLQHRLGNTINVILPAVLRLRRRLNDDPTSEEILNAIERNALFATEVIRRMQTPLQREEFARTNLNSLLREAIQ
jgi:GAF domain-containing protein